MELIGLEWQGAAFVPMDVREWIDDRNARWSAGLRRVSLGSIAAAHAPRPCLVSEWPASSDAASSPSSPTTRMTAISRNWWVWHGANPEDAQGPEMGAFPTAGEARSWGSGAQVPWPASKDGAITARKRLANASCPGRVRWAG